ncbi:hypothetical protein Q4525_14785 [Shimia thalassica]|uniref:hypothetical protein n=1 Tax=Shimia thalassica TaxID=1715693 RepID=UPI001C087815|nr:hypothetical protein [Shimia thalassica]MBU2941070.1 hypothetical protein [Shimia thalassica]MDO6504203.1 hypothetical protein [Shimia thalassica]
MDATAILAAIEAAHENRPRVEIDVPEWNCKLWFETDVTMSRQKTIKAGVDQSDENALMASYILHQAQTEDGAAVFTVDAQSRAIMEGKAGMKVIMRIMQEIGAPDDVDDAKNA